MKNLILKNVMSLMGSFFYVIFNSEDISTLHVDNIVWTMDLTVMKKYFGEFKGLKSDYSM